MWNRDMNCYTARDHAGTFDWVTENAEWSPGTDLMSWAKVVIEAAKELDLAALEDKEQEMEFPVFGYTTAEVYEDWDEYREAKIAEIESDYEQDLKDLVEFLTARDARRGADEDADEDDDDDEPQGADATDSSFEIYAKRNPGSNVTHVLRVDNGVVVDSQAIIPGGQLEYRRQYWDGTLIGLPVANLSGFSRTARYASREAYNRAVMAEWGD